MRTVGIIVEYNPLHNGHLYHLEQSLRATDAEAVVAVMSGHFLQRGEPALMDKWARTETALRSGCDLVIELPAVYATSAAEWFAYGAAALLDATGVVDALCFGSESGEIGPLRRIAAALAAEPPAFRRLLSESLAGGANYPAAYSAAVRRFLAAHGDEEAAAYPLELPNNTLGLHYLIALERLGSAIEPCTIRREKAGYADTSVTDGAIASATALRKLLREAGGTEALAGYVPHATLAILNREREAGRAAPEGWRQFERQLFHQLVRSGAAELAGFRDVGEGLEHRIKQALPKLPALSFEALIDAVKTKRYTRTRLQRAFTAILLGLRKDDWHPAALAGGLQYIRVLGFTAKGRSLLKRMRSSSKLPVLLSAADGERLRSRYLELDTQASAVYALGLGASSPRALLRDYYEAPIIV